MLLGNKMSEAIEEIKQILEKHGKKGWLRVKECEKHFVKLNPYEKPDTRRVRFYRARKLIEEDKIKDLQYVSVGKKAWIGLKDADPTVLNSQSSILKEYLLKRFWKEEEEIEHELIYGNPIRAYNKAFLLILKLPEPYRQRVEKALNIVEEELRKIDNDPNLFNFEQKNMKKRWLLAEGGGCSFLIDKIVQQLYEMASEHTMQKGIQRKSET